MISELPTKGTPQHGCMPSHVFSMSDSFGQNNAVHLLVVRINFMTPTVSYVPDFFIIAQNHGERQNNDMKLFHWLPSHMVVNFQRTRTSWNIHTGISRILSLSNIKCFYLWKHELFTKTKIDFDRKLLSKMQFFILSQMKWKRQRCIRISRS